jgi:rhodanese-related sulfurtransferase
VDEAVRILPADAKALLDKGEAVFIDVRRGSWSQSNQRIQSAVRVDPDHYEEYLGALPQGKTVITYCT